jgi:hypothetical protein
VGDVLGITWIICVLEDINVDTPKYASNLYFFSVGLEVCTLALRLGNATWNGGQEPRIGGGGSEVTFASGPSPLVL